MKKLILLSLITISFAHAQTSGIIFNENNCLTGQDMYAEDVDVSNCPALPAYPEATPMGESEELVSTGAWELGTTSTGETYKYGSLTNTNPRELVYYGEETSAPVNELNLECWAKGYYRLRQILQNPPADYIKLRDAGFQVRFFQFQTDLRNGRTGYTRISSFRDHLVKWVTVITPDGQCIQPTLGRFEDYLKGELQRRGL